MKISLTLFTLLFLLAAGKWVSGQNCGCKANECCSKYGYCGNDPDHCGPNCWSGPCSGRNGVKVGDVVTEAFFNGIIAKQDRSNCDGTEFYTRPRFLDAMAMWPTFGTIGSVDDSKREIAAFFAHVSHETEKMCLIEETNKQVYCNASYPEWPCAAGKSYYGRGPLQLTWNYNYGGAGKALGFDGLTKPEILNTEAVMSTKASLWFWMDNCHAPFVSGKGFGATIRAINSVECDGGNADKVASRVNYYKDFVVSSGLILELIISFSVKGSSNFLLKLLIIKAF